jgi:hypothetical protein
MLLHCKEQSAMQSLCRHLLTISLVGQGVCMMTMAAAFVTPALKAFSGMIALVFTILYVLSFALGSGPVPGLLSAELLPTSIRGVCCNLLG